MYQAKNEHFDIVSNLLEYLIKPDVCPDWASSIEILSANPEKELMIFTHVKVFHGKFEHHEDAMFLEISCDSGIFPDKMLNVLQNHSNPEYEGIRLSYGTLSKDVRGTADTFRAIDFKGLLKATFHCEASTITRYKSTLFLVFRDVELAIDKS